jgi:hypothetical protein
MKCFRTSVVFALLAVSSVALASEIKNWSVPSTWTPAAAQASGGRNALIATSYPPLPFIPVTPCRLIDTRAGSGFPSGYGPPSIGGGGTQRTFTIGGQCGIPASAQAVSFNFTVVGPITRGDLRLFPAGAATPAVSTLNWEANILALANAAIAPLGAGGAITVQIDGAGTVDILVDVNGFFGATPADQTRYFTLNTNSDGYTMFLTNASTTCGGACGVYQSVGSGDAIYGVTNSTSGSEAAIYGVGGGAALGVYGYSSTNIGVKGMSAVTTGDLAGVTGYDGTGVTYTGGGNLNGTAGVYGWGRSGVAGVTSSTGQWGVIGMKLTSPTVLGPFGMLGYSTYGVYSNGNTGATGTKSFVEPHPTDASKVIRYVSLEGNESGTYFRGTAQIVNGEAVIQVPEDFRIVTDADGLTVQVTPVGAPAVVWVASQDLNQIVLNSRNDVKVHYLAQGVRKAYKDFQAIENGQEFQPFSPDSTIPSYLSAEAKSRLIQNGTYNMDGTVNMKTAERLGWTQMWREEAARVRALASKPASLNPKP